jgi:hypothetical protein
LLWLASSNETGPERSPVASTSSIFGTAIDPPTN